jgi:hypothetical protein
MLVGSTSCLANVTKVVEISKLYHYKWENIYFEMFSKLSAKSAQRPFLLGAGNIILFDVVRKYAFTQLLIC